MKIYNDWFLYYVSFFFPVGAINNATTNIDDYYNELNTKYLQIANEEQATFLFRVSFIAVITGLIGIYNGKTWLGLSTCVGSLLAMNYWRDPIYGLRRNLDMISIQYLMWLHIYYVLYSPIKLLYFSIQIIGVLFYFVSWHYHTPSSLWTSTLCHGAVHLCTNISLLLFYTMT